jgi:hypothetical protein
MKDALELLPTPEVCRFSYASLSAGEADRKGSWTVLLLRDDDGPSRRLGERSAWADTEHLGHLASCPPNARL